MSDYRTIEAEFPALRQHNSHSAAWYHLWRTLHLRKYPRADRVTRYNLDMLVERAKTLEATRRLGTR